MVTKRIQVFGRVQGVFFRASTKEEADNLSLKGWVRNEPDGSVLIEVSGESNAVDELVTWCHSGPMMASVKKVEVSTISFTPSRIFQSLEISSAQILLVEVQNFFS